jgi:DNA-binding response OmpR family regulator
MSERLVSLLIVDEDVKYRSSMSRYLRQHGIRAVDVSTIGEADELLRSYSFNMVIVEWVGVTDRFCAFCENIRSQHPEILLVANSRHVDLDSQLEGYTYGVDDYWQKPLPSSLAVAKIQAMFRKRVISALSAARIRMGDIEVDFRTRLVHKNGQRVDLSEKEYGILRTLALEDGAPVRRETLLARVWGYDSVPVTRTVDNYIVALRRKLEIDPARPQYLVTVGGIGYRLNTD